MRPKASYSQTKDREVVVLACIWSEDIAWQRGVGHSTSQEGFRALFCVLPLLCASCDEKTFQGQLGCEVKLCFRGHHCHGMSVPRMVLWQSWPLAPGPGVPLIDEKPFQVRTAE